MSCVFCQTTAALPVQMSPLGTVLRAQEISAETKAPARQLPHGREGPRRPFVRCRLSHQLAVLVVGQDPRDVPVPRRDGLQRVGAGVRLRTRDGKNCYPSRVGALI